MTNDQRIALERRVARKVVMALLAAGYSVSVHDSEEVTLKRSTSLTAIMAALMTTDDDRLFAYQGAEARGWVWLIYGNSGWDLINDYATNLEDVLKPVLDYCNKLEEA